ncbi:ATP-binding cassette domain-containing protein [Corynebacterium sp. HMSC05H05]|uniref:ATP-binding cassette domain-containing protein n=1 Tax=Corynebacterium sp. HMSC05H05 TaxID=1581119 RepID=UPI0008A6575A|nr:ATP-binding cassette domain-containing protein [Corynebacterium sp. HMSC05H05]
MNNKADAHDAIVVTGANENNLRDVSVQIPKRRLTVFAGVSGSGKSSLVFDTVAAESQRLINETYSSFVQGFMPSMARPDVVGLEGVTAAIVVDQSALGANVRSTVGTATDVTPMLRVLYSRIAEPNAGGPGAYSFNVPSVSGGGAIKDATGKKKVVKTFTRTGGMCPECAGTGRASKFDEAQVVDDSLSIDDGAILAPGYKPGSWQFRAYAEAGKFPVDVPVGEIKDDPREPGGWLKVRGASENNLAGIDVDIPTGVLTAVTGVAGSGKSSLLRALKDSALLEDAVWVDQAPISGSRRSNPATYTGALDPIRKAFAKASGEPASMFSPNSAGACQHCKGAGVVYVDLGMMQGVDVPCEVCEGKRFDDAVLVHTLGGKNIAEVLAMPADEAQPYLKENKVNAAAKMCGHLIDVGLGYVTLGQPLTTLSGGERQRLKLAASLKKPAPAYVLDEPTTGLHLTDTARLVELFDRLVDSGATVIVVEHNLALVSRVDYVIDLGPGAGSAGGRVVDAGTVRQLVDRHERTGSENGRYLSS